jgi:hypothetical protein
MAVQCRADEGGTRIVRKAATVVFCYFIPQLLSSSSLFLFGSITNTVNMASSNLPLHAKPLGDSANQIAPTSNMTENEPGAQAEAEEKVISPSYLILTPLSTYGSSMTNLPKSTP